MNAFPVNSPDVISANIIKARVQPYIKSFFKIFINFFFVIKISANKTSRTKVRHFAAKNFILI